MIRLELINIFCHIIRGSYKQNTDYRLLINYEGGGIFQSGLIGPTSIMTSLWHDHTLKIASYQINE